MLDAALDDLVAVDTTLDDIGRPAALGDDRVLRAGALGVEDEREDDRECTGDHEDDPDRVARAAAHVEDAGVDVGEVEDRSDDEQEDPESDTHEVSLAGGTLWARTCGAHTRRPSNAHAWCSRRVAQRVRRRPNASVTAETRSRTTPAPTAIAIS